MFPGKLGLANRRTVGRIRRRQTAARINNRLDLPAVYGKPGDAAHLHQSRFHHMFILFRVKSGSSYRPAGVKGSPRIPARPAAGDGQQRCARAQPAGNPALYVHISPSCQPMPQPLQIRLFSIEEIPGGIAVHLHVDGAYPGVPRAGEIIVHIAGAGGNAASCSEAEACTTSREPSSYTTSCVSSRTVAPA